MREMGLIGSWERVNKYGKKHGTRLVRRLRAALRDAVKAHAAAGGGGGARKCDFRYDPWSYALNFDDGAGAGVGVAPKGGSGVSAVVRVLGQGGKSCTWAYVLWVKVE